MQYNSNSDGVLNTDYKWYIISMCKLYNTADRVRHTSCFKSVGIIQYSSSHSQQHGSGNGNFSRNECNNLYKYRRMQ